MLYFDLIIFKICFRYAVYNTFPLKSLQTQSLSMHRKQKVFYSSILSLETDNSALAFK